MGHPILVFAEDDCFFIFSMRHPILGESMKGILIIFWWFLKQIHESVNFPTFFCGLTWIHP